MVIKMVYKISVIIPCHNSQLTLERCIDSIINQTFGFENIELILYDNGSSDYTRNIIQSYSDKFTNIVPLYSALHNEYAVDKSKSAFFVKFPLQFCVYIILHAGIKSFK